MIVEVHLPRNKFKNPSYQNLSWQNLGLLGIATFALTSPLTLNSSQMADDECHLEYSFILNSVPCFTLVMLLI